MHAALWRRDHFKFIPIQKERILCFGYSHMKPEYREGAEARKNFEDGMRKLFRVPKIEVKKPPHKKKGDREK